MTSKVAPELVLRRKWVEALRSGEYQQAQRTLCDAHTNRYCCLGVLCDVVDPEGWTAVGDDVVADLPYELEDVRVEWGDEEGYGDMPPEWVMWSVGLTGEDADELADVNDGGGTYRAIASKIEKGDLPSLRENR